MLTKRNGCSIAEFAEVVESWGDAEARLGFPTSAASLDRSAFTPRGPVIDIYSSYRFGQVESWFPRHKHEDHQTSAKDAKLSTVMILMSGGL